MTKIDKHGPFAPETQQVVQIRSAVPKFRVEELFSCGHKEGEDFIVISQTLHLHFNSLRDLCNYYTEDGIHRG